MTFGPTINMKNGTRMIILTYTRGGTSFVSRLTVTVLSVQSLVRSVYSLFCSQTDTPLQKAKKVTDSAINTFFCKTFSKLITIKVSPHHITLDISTKMIIIRCLKLLLMETAVLLQFLISISFTTTCLGPNGPSSSGIYTSHTVFLFS
jgi:hypothetical protein